MLSGNDLSKFKMTESIKVICITDYYLPGYKGGGPITTIANMRLMLNCAVEIDVFTRNYDLGSANTYACVQTNSWNSSPSGQIYYASNNNFNYKGLKKAISDSNSTYQLLYLNSFFGFRSSIEINFKFHRDHPEIPILIAPRGEFSSGALAIKPLRKKLFIMAASIMRLYDEVKWHASTVHEKSDILTKFSAATNNIYVAEDPISIEANLVGKRSYDSSPKGTLRLIFISRISLMKNLDGLLDYLGQVNCSVELDIFGPIEDEVYWTKCKGLITTLPENIKATYKNAIEPAHVSDTFSSYDLFVFPSRGENFGHVIFEALRAGTPVLISDQTPWKEDANGAVTVVPLHDAPVWVTHIQAAADRSSEEKRGVRYAARAYAEKFAADSAIFDKNISMFRAVLGEDRIPSGEQILRRTSE